MSIAELLAIAKKVETTQVSIGRGKEKLFIHSDLELETYSSAWWGEPLASSGSRTHS